METEVLKSCDVEIGDLVEIIDPLGGGLGSRGDFGKVVSIEGRGSKKDDILKILLTTGNDQGHITGRFVFRHRLVQREWDK